PRRGCDRRRAYSRSIVIFSILARGPEENLIALVEGPCQSPLRCRAILSADPARLRRADHRPDRARFGHTATTVPTNNQASAFWRVESIATSLDGVSAPRPGTTGLRERNACDSFREK